MAVERWLANRAQKRAKRQERRETDNGKDI